MNVYEAILKRRSIRKYKQDKIEESVLKKLVNAARMAPYGANLQPLKFCIVSDRNVTDQIFENTKWAAYIRPEGTPKKGEEPVAYIVILCDKDIKKTGYDTDAGIAGVSIILAAVEEGLGSCWLGAIDRENIRQILNIPQKYDIHSLIALGYPAEEPVAEDMDNSIKYYKDKNGVLHVPKRKLEDVIVKIV